MAIARLYEWSHTALWLKVRSRLGRPTKGGTIQFLLSFPLSLTSICNPLGCGRHATLVSLHLFSSLVKCPCQFLVALSRRICFCDFWAFSVLSFAFFDLIIQQIFARMIILLLPSNSLSLAPSLPPTSVVFKISNSGPSAFSSATSFANPFFFSPALPANVFGA